MYMSLSPLTSKGDWHLISPHNISPESDIIRVKGNDQ